MITDRIAARAFNAPLLIDQGKAEAILAGLGQRFTGEAVEIDNAIGAIEHIAFAAGRPSLGKLGDGLGRAYDRAGVAPFDMVDNVAVIAIEGTLVHKGSFVGQSSGRTSYQGLQTQVARAARDPQVKGVVFEIDSYGGEAAGAFDAADAIAGLSVLKPTLAILTENALSGGYLLGAQARSIIAPEFGRAGSIGVIKLHYDLSRKLANDGIKVTVLAAGKHKADGNPFEPLAPDVAAAELADLERMRQQFAAYVGRGRGPRLPAARALATEAGDFSGAQALSLGLIDAVGKPSDAFDAFIAEINRKR